MSQNSLFFLEFLIFSGTMMVFCIYQIWSVSRPEKDEAPQRRSDADEEEDDDD
jgi:hypothetical protein